MPDITLRITTNNLSTAELEKLHRDIALIKSAFNEAGRAALIFSANIQTTFKQLQIARNRIIASEPISTYQNISENALNLLHKGRLDSFVRNNTEKTLKNARRANKRQFLRKSDFQPRLFSKGDLQNEDDFQSTFFDRSDFQSRLDTQYIPDITHAQRAIVKTISDVPSDIFRATYDALITIPAQTREELQELKVETKQRIVEVNDSEVLSVEEKASQIEQIERDAAQRRKAIETEANQAKIDSFNRVVRNFIAGIGKMIAAQLKLRVAASITNRLLGTALPTQTGGLLSAVSPVLSANPVLGLALGATTLFATSFDDPVNDALAQQAGIRQAQQRATDLGRRSAVDLKANFERGFVAETARQQTATTQQTDGTAPVVMNEIKLIIGGQEIKALYEETQRQIATGIISVSP
ncbi:hypothetical protein F4212_08975 [Candidatus Poribacteria bacterium]|nr:hypothetical protein [Candidatus Poribacteria bacterium]